MVIINKSDATGGAAVVSRRLMEALREEGVDARMLVCEKLTDSPFVEPAASPKKIRRKFLKERLKIFLISGFNRKNLFKIDTGEEGLKLWKHPMVTEADAILVNWVNQGMLSLKGVRKILKLRKPVIWTMHDMWCMTGICHHAGKCRHFEQQCGDCPLLGWKASVKDFSFKTWKRKNKIFSDRDLMRGMCFVGVSNWLKERSKLSGLLKDKRMEVIPNAFKAYDSGLRIREEGGAVRILFGAARLDDPIKGLPTLRLASHILKEEHPSIAENMEIAVFGGVKDSSALEDFALPVVRLGILKGEKEIAEAYRNADIVVSASSYETLPGTLVEAQAYGCVPVCFRRGGQPDIIDQLATGYMAEYDPELDNRARNLVKGILWAYTIVTDPVKHRNIMHAMRENVEKNFSYHEVAGKYISLIKELKASLND